ncbi:MAG: pyridoxal phosphate-dependent aminotransferase [Bacteroidota bacterium]
MERISDRLAALSVSETLAMTQKSRELKAQGIDVINLSIGEPDFNTPEHIKEAAKQAIDDNFSHYSPVPGYDSLREAISKKFKRENNLNFTKDQIVVSGGAKQSIANVALSILNKGDEVIVPAPYWVSYVDIIKLAEATNVIINAGIESDFKVTPQQIENAITPKTRAFLFSSPSNPTGNLYNYDELKAIAGVFAKYPDIIIISDEIYEHINFVDRHQSIAQFEELKDRVVVVNGVSKGYAMTGWRIGYIGAPLWIAKGCTKLQGQYTSGSSSIAQKASEAALNSEQSPVEISKMREIFKRRRNLIVDLLSKIDGLKINLPQGAFYVFPDISSFLGKSFNGTEIPDSTALSMFLLNNAHVATVCGSAFGSDNCLRLSYATSDEQIIESVKRISTALKLLK